MIGIIVTNVARAQNSKYIEWERGLCEANKGRLAGAVLMSQDLMDFLPVLIIAPSYSNHPGLFRGSKSHNPCFTKAAVCKVVAEIGRMLGAVLGKYSNPVPLPLRSLSE